MRIPLSTFLHRIQTEVPELNGKLIYVFEECPEDLRLVSWRTLGQIQVTYWFGKYLSEDLGDFYLCDGSDDFPEHTFVVNYEPKVRIGFLGKHRSRFVTSGNDEYFRITIT